MGELILYRRVAILSDDCSSAYVFSAKVLMAELSEATAQRLLHWCVYLGQLSYEIIHLPGEDNCWGGLPSHWRRIGAEADGEGEGLLNVHAVAVETCANADFTLPPKNAVKMSQLKVAPKKQTRWDHKDDVRCSGAGFRGLVPHSLEGWQVLWILKEGKRLRSRLMVCANMDTREWRRLYRCRYPMVCGAILM